jgi:hypothetical protein
MNAVREEKGLHKRTCLNTASSEIPHHTNQHAFVASRLAINPAVGNVDLDIGEIDAGNGLANVFETRNIGCNLKARSWKTLFRTYLNDTAAQ